MKFVIKPGFEIIDHRMIHLQGPQKANNNQPEELITNSTWSLTEPRAESLNMKKKMVIKSNGPKQIKGIGSGIRISKIFSH